MNTTVHLFRCADDGLVVKCIVDDVDAHRLASLIVKVLKQWPKVLQFQNSQQVVVAVDGQLHQTHQLLGHCTASLQTMAYTHIQTLVVAFCMMPFLSSDSAVFKYAAFSNVSFLLRVMGKSQS